MRLREQQINEPPTRARRAFDELQIFGAKHHGAQRAEMMTGWLGSGTTHAKFVPAPVKRVSITSRSVPLEKQISARWSGIVILAG